MSRYNGQSDMDVSYSIIGVRRDASPNSVKAAYRKKCLVLHPDKASKDEESQAKAKEKFQELQDAYNEIQNRQREEQEWREQQQQRAQQAELRREQREQQREQREQRHMREMKEQRHNYHGHHYNGGPSSYHGGAEDAQNGGGGDHYYNSGQHTSSHSSYYGAGGATYSDARGTGPPGPGATASAWGGYFNSNGGAPGGMRGGAGAATGGIHSMGNPHWSGETPKANAPGMSAFNRTRAWGAASSSANPSRAQQAAGVPPESLKRQRTDDGDQDGDTGGSGIPKYQYRDESNTRDEYRRPGPRNEFEEEHDLRREGANNKAAKQKAAAAQKSMANKEKLRNEKRTKDYALRLQRLRARFMSAKFILVPVEPKKCDAMVVPTNWPTPAPDPGTKSEKRKHCYTRVMARNNMKVSNTHFKLSNSVAYPDALIIEDYSSNGTCINGKRIPGVSIPKTGRVQDGDIISLSGNELPEDLDESSPSDNMRLRVEYTPVLKRFDATEVDALFNQLEKADNITKEMLNDTGLAREMRYWKDADFVKRKEPELAERAAHLFQLWRDKFKAPAAG